MSLDWSTIKKGDLLYEFGDYTVEILVLEDARRYGNGWRFKGRTWDSEITFSYTEPAYAPKLMEVPSYAGLLIRIDGERVDI